MEVASSVAEKIMDVVFGAVKKETGYMWNCSKNIINLNKEVEKLTAVKDTLQQRIEDANRKAEVPGKDLEMWMKNADAEISEAKKFIDEEAESKKTCCNLHFCVNLGTLYHYGKTATKKSSTLLKHQQDGERFKNCSFDPLPTPREIDLYQRKNFENINTLKLILKQITEAIEDDMIQIVGITGLGGVGKTTLANEVAIAAEMKNKFKYIEFIAVSKTVDANVIKKKVEVAAKRIIDKKQEKVLIILDDVWEELKLDEVGIPCGSDYMNCKILLTSRMRDVCVAMNAKHIITVNPLEKGEAWTLFERGVGKTDWDNKLKQVALEIVEECGGLPLFLQAVAKALKDKEIESWEAALNRIKAPTHGDAKYKKEGILQLKLSYDCLEDEVAKSCFLLCSMFPEDATMGLERLTYYGLGLGIFDNLDTNIQDAKHIVRGAIDILKSSFLLLPEKEKRKSSLSVLPKTKDEEEEEEKFKMHDLVRDMAMLITSKGNGKFLVESGTGLTEWLPRKDLERYNKISLLGNKIYQLPGHELFFPNLDTFLIQDNEVSVVPDKFFGGMEKLKVLDMSGNKIPSLPQSLKQLTLLRLLDLSGNNSLREISILGVLTCLEILKLRSTGITNIPEEIGQLINLRVLDVSSCEDLSYVAPGVISKLIWLEELYVGFKEGDCKFILELTELKLLKILHLLVPELQYIPEDFHFETLIEFHIIERINSQEPSTHGCKRILQIAKDRFPFPKRIMKLIQLSDMLHLWRILDLDSIIPALFPEGFDGLKYVNLAECIHVRSLVNTSELDVMRHSNEFGPTKTKGNFFSQVENITLMDMYSLEVLWDSPHQYTSFCNLKEIYIDHCPSLLKLFPLSVAQGLVNMTELTVWTCKNLVVVISAEDEQIGGSEIEETGGSKTELVNQDTYIVFPHLSNIAFFGLSNLESFYSGHSIIMYPSLKLIELFQCSSMKRWSYGENHMPNLESKHQPYSNINDYIAAELDVSGSLTLLKSQWDDTEGSSWM